MTQSRAPSSAITVRQKTDRIKGIFDNERVRAQIAESVPKTLASIMTPDKVTRLLLVAANKSPNLAECSIESILGAVFHLSVIGLDFSGVSGEAYIIPRRNKNKGGAYEAVPQIGYKGYLKLFYRNDKVQSAVANLVYENDEFDFKMGEMSAPVHNPPWSDRGKLLGGYAVVYLTNGGVIKERMSIKEMEDIRQRSPSKNSQAWLDYPDQMYRKMLISRIANYTPLTSDVMSVIALDKQHDSEHGSAKNEAIDYGDFDIFGEGEAPALLNAPPSEKEDV